MAGGQADEAYLALLRLEEGQLATDSLHSVFSVEVNLYHLLPGGEDHDQSKRAYYLKTRKVNPALPKTPEDVEAAEKEKEKEKKKKRGRGSNVQEPSEEASKASEAKGLKASNRNDGQRNATGFAIAQNGTTLRILTCAHTIDEVYGAGVHDITVSEVNEFFSFDVHCSHQESRILSQLNGKRIDEQDRVLTQATVVALDTEKDLMVLEIDTGDIHYAEGGIMCENQHPIISMVGSDPTALEVCILQGWPPQRMGSLSIGQLSFESRTYEAIMQLNEKGYNMSLVEFTKMEGDEGISGGPAINGRMESLGVYHGMIGAKGYVVSAKDVIQFLQKFGVLSDWSDDDEMR